MEPARPTCSWYPSGRRPAPRTTTPQLCQRDADQTGEAPKIPAVYGGEAGRRTDQAWPEHRTSQPIYAWTDLTYLLHKHQVSWGNYVVSGTEPDCENTAAETCAPVTQNANTPGIWNPLPWFDTVKADHKLGNIQDVNKFYAAAKDGHPARGVVGGALGRGERAPAGPVSFGQSYVTSLVNAVMQSPDWDSTAIFLAWDDWGGFYDNVVPRPWTRTANGLRVPGMVISPYAKSGYIDHQTLSFDAYDKFIEDLFLNGQRIDPRTDGRPRSEVRRPRKCEVPRQSGQRLRLRPDSSLARDPGHSPEDHPGRPPRASSFSPAATGPDSDGSPPGPARVSPMGRG